MFDAKDTECYPCSESATLSSILCLCNAAAQGLLVKFILHTEYMSGGSVYDYLHQQKAVLRIPMLLRVAIDVSKAMNYLHQNKIIHRDLKAANLLMDENEVRNRLKSLIDIFDASF